MRAQPYRSLPQSVSSLGHSASQAGVGFGPTGAVAAPRKASTIGLDWSPGFSPLAASHSIGTTS